MSEDAAVVWLDAGDAQQDAQRALAEWAQARGLRLGPPASGASSSSVSDSSGSGSSDLSDSPDAQATALGGEVERELQRARDALGAADADAAERALARAEATLRAHPEMPQAAWLLAECSRAWSARWLQIAPRDEARARAAWESAEALDGGRVVGVGETRFPAPAVFTASIVLDGADPARTIVHFDGRALAAPTEEGRSLHYRTDARAGEHQLVVTTHGRVAFAGWVALLGAAPSVHLPIADKSACTREDLAAARREGDRVIAAGVGCERWVAAARGDRPGAVLVARCQSSACGPLLEWRSERFGAVGPPQALEPSRPWPAWATWTLVGAGVVAGAAVALFAGGVFEGRPVEQRFVVGGARTE